MKINYSKLSTEKSNPLSKSLDRLSVRQVIMLMNREDRKIPYAIEREAASIVRAVNLTVKALSSGGRIFFVGAGTSGRLGVIESAEMPPTFNTPPDLVQAIMSGGRRAVFKSKEGAEDDFKSAGHQIRKKVRKGDVVIGSAASGVTPFVRSALNQAQKLSAGTVLVTCSTGHVKKRDADVVITLSVGPEIITGSTRLKSATATKMVLNMITTASMIRMGKVYGNRMVDLQPKSRKLRERGIGLVQDLASCSRQEARKFFNTALGSVKTAVLMARKKFSYKSARDLLKQNRGFLAPSLKR